MYVYRVAGELNFKRVGLVTDTQEDGYVFTYVDTVSEMDVWPGKCTMYLKQFFQLTLSLPLSSRDMIDGIPSDGIPIEEVVTVAVPLTVVYVILATAGLLFTVVCLAFNFIFRKRR